MNSSSTPLTEFLPTTRACQAAPFVGVQSGDNAQPAAVPSTVGRGGSVSGPMRSLPVAPVLRSVATRLDPRWLRPVSGARRRRDVWLVTEWRRNGRKGHRPIARRAEELDAADIDNHRVPAPARVRRPRPRPPPRATSPGRRAGLSLAPSSHSSEVVWSTDCDARPRRHPDAPRRVMSLPRRSRVVGQSLAVPSDPDDERLMAGDRIAVEHSPRDVKGANTRVAALRGRVARIGDRGLPVL
jgi:hypothetical protein